MLSGGGTQQTVTGGHGPYPLGGFDLSAMQVNNVANNICLL